MHWTGWVGGWMDSEIGHFYLLTVHIEWVGRLENPPKHAYVIFEWSLNKDNFLAQLKATESDSSYRII
jgi:hypothetical protein